MQGVDRGGADFVVHGNGGVGAGQRDAVFAVDLEGELRTEVEEVDELGLAGEGFDVHAEPQSDFRRRCGAVQLVFLVLEAFGQVAGGGVVEADGFAAVLEKPFDAGCRVGGYGADAVFRRAFF